MANKTPHYAFGRLASVKVLTFLGKAFENQERVFVLTSHHPHDTAVACCSCEKRQYEVKASEGGGD